MKRPRTEPACYLLHFEPRYKHAGHYAGCAFDGDVDRRVREHLAGIGANLVAVAVAAGCSVEIARVWRGQGRDRERTIKHKASPYCPICRARARFQPRLPL